MDEAIAENAAGMENANMVINAEAAGVENEAGGNDIAPRGLAYSCMAENCEFKTPVCSRRMLRANC